jgi:hypothetical protein
MDYRQLHYVLKYDNRDLDIYLSLIVWKILSLLIAEKIFCGFNNYLSRIIFFDFT